MRTISLFTFIALIALFAVPAFAEWTEALEAAPVETLSVGKEVSKAPVEVTDNSARELAREARETEHPTAPAPVLTTATKTEQPHLATLNTDATTPKPSYMVVYKTATDLKPPTMVTVLDPRNPSAVPEPGSLLALASGLGGLAFKLRKRRK